MPAVLVRNLDDAVIDSLKRRASASHRSLEAELRVILEEAAAPSSRRKGRRRRALKLHTVAVGGTSTHGRDEIYGDEER
jgi:plasmid stability protein